MHTNARTGTPSPKSKPLHRYNLVNDAGESRGRFLGAFHLQRKFMAVEFVSYPSPGCRLTRRYFPACVLKLMKPQKHFARVESVRAAVFLSAPPLE